MIRVFRPLENPARELATLLVGLLEPDAPEIARLDEVDQLVERLREGRPTMGHVASRLREQRGDRARLVLIADQFEELYTPGRDAAVHQAFISALLEVVQAGMAVVLALHADCCGHALNDPRLGQVVDAGKDDVFASYPKSSHRFLGIQQMGKCGYLLQ